MRPKVYLIPKVGILLFLIIICSSKIKSDLPVHCKREQIEGEWIFRINSDVFNPDINDFKTTCGHGFPDKIEKMVGDVNYSFESFHDITLILTKDYKIYEHNSSSQVGKWTPIYDEGFIVYYKNSVFTAFMKYFLKQKTTSPKPSNSLYTSNCDKTMIGWVIQDQIEIDKNWSCFFGFKSKIKNEFMLNNRNFLKPNKKFNKFDYDKNKNDNISNTSIKRGEYFSSIENSNSDFSLNFVNTNSNYNSNFNYEDSPELDSFLEIKTRNKSNMQMNLLITKYEEQKEIINEINNSNLSWKAHINDEFRGLSFLQLKQKMGMKKNKSSNADYLDNSFINTNNNIKSDSSIDSLDNELNEDIKVSLYNKDIHKQRNAIDNYDPNSYYPFDFDSFANVSLLNLNKQSKSNSINDVGYNLNSNLHNEKNNFKSTFNTSANILITKLSKQENQDITSTKYHEPDSSLETDYSVISKYLDKEIEEIDENALPKNWDWRNVGGINYVPHPRKQGDCGSCYIFSIVSSLESRLRILTNNKDKTEFSRQFPVSCSFYTEGCEGGYPILVAKFFNEFEILPESCLEYQAKNGKCSDVCDSRQNPIKYYVSKYEYLGGFYGATNEVAIMKELRARGPIPGNMTVPWSFSYYKSGIFSEKNLKKNSGKLSKTTLLDKNLSWSTVDHSILLVGYGEENGTKYWIGMNTWGTNWGENGFFKILRGENDCNIETMGDAARIAFKPRK